MHVKSEDPQMPRDRGLSQSEARLFVNYSLWGCCREPPRPNHISPSPLVPTWLIITLLCADGDVRVKIYPHP